ncbi:YwiC-like family protein [Bifidobacterium simiiventris]|uniref:YwiC-like family protein n=1 Tax=Bifidobacterium simiiventris TaxID=2834434 RepID=UPI001C5597FC|nr:YwiC-like family protein [Bifidobacterium simiiventris]MBW3078601.1 YwiC-like family protein [Bifidobacterium simiiventris]
MTTPTTRSAPNHRHTTPRDWIPDQPGAWAMAILPTLAGMIVGGANTATVWLLIAWILCYCVQFTAARWLKSRFARRYLPPTVIYTVLLAAIGLPFVALHPTILWWAPLYIALAGLSFAAAWLRRERTLWGNAVAILAACTMAMVVGSFGNHAADARIPALANGGLPAAVVFLLAQFGSVLFVKTMIRERGNAGYLWASWIWHGVLLAAAFGLWGLLGFGRLFAMLTITCAWLMMRAVAMPLVARRRAVRPIAVGLVEMVSSLLVFAAVVMTF